MAEITRRQALATAAGAAATGFMPLSSRAQARRPSLKIAAQGIPGNLEPIELIGNTGNRVANAIYDTVIYRDFLSNAEGSGTALKPGIAESWRRLDGRTIEVTLRPNVKFHNGATVTAEDVAFTLGPEKLWGPKPLSARGPVFAPDFEAVEVTGPMTVRFSTKSADVSLEQRLASWVARVVPKAYFMQVGPDGFATRPIGTGPYKLRELRSGESITLEAHDEYWMGRPTAETVTFVAVPETSTRLAGLISGEFDIATTLTTDAIPQLRRQRDVEARGVVIENVHLITYQCDEPVLADKRVRQALNLAIDRQLMSQSIWGGLANVPNGFQFPEYGAVFEPTRVGLQYNPERARALLREAGYNNQRIVYRTLPSWYANAVPAAQMVQQFWRQVGVNADIQIFETWQQLLAQPGIQVRNWSNGFQMPDPVTPLTSDWGPRGGVQRQNGWKAPEEYNALIPTIIGSADPAERKRAFQRFIDIWEDEAPGTILYRPYELYGVKKTINWKPVSFEFMELRPNNLSFNAM